MASSLTPPSLTAASQRQNNQVSLGFHPTSILHQLINSANAMSSVDADRRLYGGGMMSTSNGMSADYYRESHPLATPVLNA